MAKKIIKKTTAKKPTKIVTKKASKTCTCSCCKCGKAPAKKTSKK
jgi:hypothetical protein